MDVGAARHTMISSTSAGTFLILFRKYLGHAPTISFPRVEILKYYKGALDPETYHGCCCIFAVVCRSVLAARQQRTNRRWRFGVERVESRPGLTDQSRMCATFNFRIFTMASCRRKRQCLHTMFLFTFVASCNVECHLLYYARQLHC